MNGGLYLRVTQPVAPTWEFLARILMLCSAGMVGLACVDGYWLAHRALRPIENR